MSDLIERQAAIDAMQEWDWQELYLPIHFRQLLEELPSVSVAEKVGRWKDYSEDGYVECPFCGSLTTCDKNTDELHYCFNCGARMEGVEE